VGRGVNSAWKVAFRLFFRGGMLIELPLIGQDLIVI
jgi:hypothetical protein